MYLCIHAPFLFEGMDETPDFTTDLVATRHRVRGACVALGATLHREGDGLGASASRATHQVPH